MSVIRVICPECDKTLAIKASAAGKIALCPACKSKIRIPDATDEDDFEPAPPPRKAPVKSRVEEPPPRKRRPVEDEEEEAPRRKPLKIDDGALRRRQTEEEEEYPEPVDEDEEDRKPKKKKKKKKGRKDGDEGGEEDGVEYNPGMGFLFIVLGLAFIGGGVWSIVDDNTQKYYIGALLAGPCLIWQGFQYFRQN